MVHEHELHAESKEQRNYCRNSIALPNGLPVRRRLEPYEKRIILGNTFYQIRNFIARKVCNITTASFTQWIEEWHDSDSRAHRINLVTLLQDQKGLPEKDRRTSIQVMVPEKGGRVAIQLDEAFEGRRAEWRAKLDGSLKAKDGAVDTELMIRWLAKERNVVMHTEPAPLTMELLVDALDEFTSVDSATIKQAVKLFELYHRENPAAFE
jgi:hypothetical protein